MDEDQSTHPHRRNHKPPILRLPFWALLIVPVALAIVACVLLFLHSDLNVAALYSQCSAHSRLPGLSRIPVLGPPSCFMISFFHFTLASSRSWGVMCAILAYVTALLTTALLESARLFNRNASWVITKPTVPWLVFNLVGGTLVWDLVLVPAFLRHAKNVQVARESASAERMRVHVDEDIDLEVRALSSQVEGFAIPIAVTVGYVLPSLAMLFSRDPVSIGVWLFFPLWVAVVRYLVKVVGVNAVRDPTPWHMESRRSAVIGVYALPVLLSAIAHGVFIWSLVRGQDDRREMTRSAIKFVEIDVLVIGATVLYWILVEAGFLVVLAFIGASVILGPGAGLCLAWVLRERAIENYTDGTERGGEETEREDNGEETPLLR